MEIIIETLSENKPQPSEQLWKLVKNELKGIGFIRYHLILAGK
jgi:hypothetical protein